MLYDIKRKILNKDELKNSKEYKDLAYDLESFIIDNCYPAEMDGYDVEKSEFAGKIALRNILYDEYESEFVSTRLRPILVCLGIPEALKGFRMLETLVLECAKCLLESKQYRLNLVYPVVAERFGITAHNCERLCRYACSFAKPDAKFSLNYPMLESLSHRTVESVTVKELVDLLVWYLVDKCSFNRKKF